MDLEAMVARVRNTLKDLDETSPYWSDAEVEAAIVAALGEFAKACPDVASADLDGDGSTRTFDVADGEDTPPAGYLYTLAVEYPIDTDPPQYVPFSEYTTGSVILRGVTPPDGTDNVRVWYAKAYDSEAETWTVPVEDEQTIEIGAAGSLAESGARYASGRINASVDAPGLLRKSAYGWGAEFRTRLNRARSRQVGPQWWTSWRVDEDDV
jgi:hypothetical protein